jgi:hypothetical protein
MMIDIDVSQLDGIVRAWLKDTLKTVQHNAARSYVHPDDAKQYKKDIKALKWVLEYIGDSK